MIKGFYTGTTGAIEHQKMMSVIANNIANTNTKAFKASRLTFQDLIYQNARMPQGYTIEGNTFASMADEDKASSMFFSENKLTVGAGARANESALVFTQGSYEFTDSYLDVIIDGAGFFAVEGDYGEMYYTRDGAFSIANIDDELYLVNKKGEFVLDENYNRIILPTESQGVVFVPPGQATGADEYEVSVGLFLCNNVYGLKMVGGDKFVPTENSGEMSAYYGENVRLINHALEMSNVNLAEEMVRMISTQRAYQLNLTMIRTADEIEGYTNTLRS